MKKDHFEKSRMKPMITILLVSLLLVSALSITGCVDEEESGKTFTIGYVGEPKDFHPIRYTAGQETGQFLQQIFDPLLVSYFEGKPSTEGHAVAENYEIENDGMKYTFEIEEGIKFHNGEELKAEDVAFTIHTMMMGEDNDTYFNMYDVDKNPSSVRQSEFDEVDYVEATGDYTLEIHMEQFSAEFLVSDGFQNMRIVPKDYIEDNGWDKFDEELIGTGPFEFDNYAEGNEIVLQRFEDAHVEMENDIQEVVISFYGDESAAVTALQDGSVQFVPGISGQNYEDLKSVEGVTSDAYSLGGTMYVAFNHEEGPTTNVKVRKAIAYAIDVDEVIEGVQASDTLENKRSMVPEDHPAYNSSLNMYSQDKEKAQELLEEAGYSDGLTLDFYAWEASTSPMPIIQQQLSDVGIETEITTLEWGGFMDAMEAAEPDIMYTGWPGAASAKYMMGWLTQGHYDIKWGLFYNSTAYTDKMEQAYQTPDFDERMNLYQEAQGILVNEEMGLFNIWHESDTLAYRSNINIPDKAMIAYNDGPLTHLHLFEIEG